MFYFGYTQNNSPKEEGLMEENKRKKIEARLFQLFAQNEQNKNENQLIKNIYSDVKVIRRRKGKPDLHIS
ncbi:MAG: hypothetical protein ACT6FB_06195 [Methanosarcinaceae archaeon]